MISEETQLLRTTQKPFFPRVYFYPKTETDRVIVLPPGRRAHLLWAPCPCNWISLYGLHPCLVKRNNSTQTFTHTLPQSIISCSDRAWTLRWGSFWYKPFLVSSSRSCSTCFFCVGEHNSSRSCWPASPPGGAPSDVMCEADPPEPKTCSAYVLSPAGWRGLPVRIYWQ